MNGKINFLKSLLQIICREIEYWNLFGGIFENFEYLLSKLSDRDLPTFAITKRYFKEIVTEYEPVTCTLILNSRGKKVLLFPNK